MHSLTFELLLCLALSVPAKGNGNVNHAYIEVRGAAHSSGYAYLIEGAFLKLPGTIADSAKSDKAGIFRFRISPNPTVPYEIRIGLTRLFWNHGLSPGDSIIISDTDDIDSILFDRVGANLEFSHVEESIQHAFYPQLYRRVPCPSLDSIRSVLKGVRAHFISRVKIFRARYFNHPILCQELESQADIFLDKELTNVIWWREVQEGLHPCEFPLFATSISDLKSVYSPYLLAISHDLLEIEAHRWYQRGKDTAGINAYLLSEQLRIALVQKGFFRDVCLYEVVKKANQDANQGISIVLSGRLAKEALDTLRALHGDERIIQLVEATQAAIMARRRGTRAYNFTLPDSEGKIVSLAQFEGKVVLLHYWGTWCGPCLQTLPETELLEQRHESDSNLVCINIAVEQSGFNHWKKFIVDHHLSGIQLYAKADIVRERSRPTGFQWVQWFPSYILIDRHGCLISADENRPNKHLEADIMMAERQ